MWFTSIRRNVFQLLLRDIDLTVFGLLVFLVSGTSLPNTGINQVVKSAMANIERNTFELNVSTNYLEIHFSTFLIKYALRCGCVGVCICLSNPKKCNVEIDKVSMALQVSGLLAIYWCQCSFFQTRSKSEWNQLRCLLKIFWLFFSSFFSLLYSSIHLKRQLDRVKVRKTLTHFYLPVKWTDENIASHFSHLRSWIKYENWCGCRVNVINHTWNK